MSWRWLKVSPSAGAHLPAFLISVDFTSLSYTIRLSDITNIWEESLHKQDIIRRSREEGTSIDPTDGDQFAILLQKIKIGLYGGRGSQMALGITDQPILPSLILHLTVDLPGGLAPLVWSIRFHPAPQILLSQQLVVPLLRAQHDYLQQIVALGEVVKEKDHVIQKLVDKLESQGTDMSLVFPQVTSRPGRKVDRKQAEERVKGLKLFDMDDWKTNMSSDAISQKIASLVDDAYGAVGTQSDDKISISNTSENWWEDLAGITVNLRTGKISTRGRAQERNSPVKIVPQSGPISQDSVDTNDGFQVQATPPHLKRTVAAKVDSTDDDEDLDSPSQQSKIPVSLLAVRRTASDSTSWKPSPPLRTSKEKAKNNYDNDQKGPRHEAEAQDQSCLDADTTTDDDEAVPSPPSSKTRSPRHIETSTTDTVAPSKTQKGLAKVGGKKEVPRAQSPEPTNPAPAAKKARLGKISGKKSSKESSPPPPQAPPPIHTDGPNQGPITSPQRTARPASPPNHTPRPPHRKIGMIGHKKRDVTAATTTGAAAEEPPSALQDVEEPKPEISEAEVVDGKRDVGGQEEEVEETPEEKADRKRLQLKRELEEKAKAPAKRRKKF